MKPFVPLEEMIEGSASLYEELAIHLRDEIQVSSDRADLASVFALMVIEHARSILMLISASNPSSALALIRVQFEALVRGFWIRSAATDAAINKCIAPIAPETVKEPTLFPTISDMLKQIAGKAPPPVVRALTDFKAAAWDAMNSFVHGNLRAMVGIRNGHHPGLLSQTIQNANGAAMFATMLLADVTSNPTLSLAVVAMSRTHARALPPLNYAH